MDAISVSLSAGSLDHKETPIDQTPEEGLHSGPSILSPEKLLFFPSQGGDFFSPIPGKKRLQPSLMVLKLTSATRRLLLLLLGVADRDELKLLTRQKSGPEPDGSERRVKEKNWRRDDGRFSVLKQVEE